MVSGNSNVAIGPRACRYVTGSNKTCIGSNSGPSSPDDESASNSKDVVYIGNSGSTVYIPGNLIVGRKTYLGTDLDKDDISGMQRSHVYMKFRYRDSVGLPQINEEAGNASNLYHDTKDYTNDVKELLSDRRLKYVGKENTSGLDKIRQLKVFNYTFKKDEKKTPHVGVIAQDLQKVFPDAVKKGVDGFLTIRMEDMFYAVINAIKELDIKYQAQEKRINELEKRIDKLEAKIK